MTLVSRMPQKPLIANVDADLLKQAALNVIQNGAQAMPRWRQAWKCRWNWRTELAPAMGRHRPLRMPFCGTDEGPGIPEEIREKIFDLYFTTKSGGSGIGLAMTYRILQLHHGSVEVQSKVGRGTEFRLRIPLAATDWGTPASSAGES